MKDENPLSEDFCQQVLLEHLAAVLKQNQTMNLTSIESVEAGKVLHIEDSLAVLPELAQAPCGRLADIGSGAGFPGIPLAVSTGRETTLIESIQKKAAFLSRFIAEHTLQHIQVAALRSEELALRLDEPYAAVTTRAVAALPCVLELATPLLMTGGRCLVLKGAPAQEELERGEKAAALLGLSLVGTRFYTLSDGVSQRCVLAYERTTSASVRLPRRPGKATRSPLA